MPLKTLGEVNRTTEQGMTKDTALVIRGAGMAPHVLAPASTANHTDRPQRERPMEGSTAVIVCTD